MRYLTWIFCFGLIGCTSGDDSGTDTDTGDTGEETGETDDTDTGVEPGPCDSPVVIFETTDGTKQDVTSFFASGDYLTLGVAGTLSVCPGTWFSRVVIRANVSVVGLGDSPRDTIMSGGESGTILDIAGPNVTVNVDNVTLDRGAGLDVEHNSGGGAIYCEQQGKVVVNDVEFTNNFANDGAGLYSRECELDINRSSFTNNLVEDDGGAITLWDSTARFSDVTVSNNSALDGGAMGVFQSTVTMSDSAISNNTASNFGAGIWSVDSSITLTDVTITDNVNSGRDYGGGLIVQGTATLTRVTFSDNTARQGGGIYVYYDAVVDGYDCNFSRNQPEDIFAINSRGGTAYRGGTNYSFSCAENSCRSR